MDKEMSRTVITWAPRVLAIAYLLFLSLFALDVFGHGQGFWRTLGALLMHLVPSFVLLGIVLLAWRWEWVGALGSAALLGLFLWWNYTYRHNTASAVLVVAGPLALMTVLYLAAWLMRVSMKTPSASMSPPTSL